MHILDLLENSLRAHASLITLRIEEDKEKGILKVYIKDNGMGMDPKDKDKLLDPFFTTKSGKKVGLGIPLFYQTCKTCDGDLRINTNKGQGMEIDAYLRLDSIDLPPYGDIGGVISGVLLTNPHVDLELFFKRGEKCLSLDTRGLKEAKKDITPKRLLDLRDAICKFFEN